MLLKSCPACKGWKRYRYVIVHRGLYVDVTECQSCGGAIMQILAD